MDQGPVAPSRPWLAIGREIAGVLERVDPQAFERLVDRFRDPSRRWFFSGQGRSGLAAQMAAMRFMHMGRSAHFVGEPTPLDPGGRRTCAGLRLGRDARQHPFRPHRQS